MLSYQHIYHAGNHADVLKHTVLFAIMESLVEKAKPLSVLDSHAGEGKYSLDSHKLGQEYHDGVGRLLNQMHTIPTESVLSRYLSHVKDYAETGFYPGSPCIVERFLREDVNGKRDQCYLNDLHPTAFSALTSNCADFAHCFSQDSYAFLNAVAPPLHKRGVVIIDPPFEQASEYQQVITATQQLLSVWSTPCVAIWFPHLSERAGEKALLSKAFAQNIHTALADVSKNIAWFSLDIAHRDNDIGMFGSSMLVINCPFQVDRTIQASLDIVNVLWRDVYPGITTSTSWLKAPV